MHLDWRQWLRRERPALVPAGEAYAIWADTYTPEPHNPLMRVEQAIVAPILADACPHSALDVGTGTGRNLAVLESLGVPRVVGIDLSLPMLRRVGAGTPRICGDAARLPFAAMSFDLGQVMQLRQKAPALVRGITAAEYRPKSYRDLLPRGAQHGLGYIRAGLKAKPQFLAYSVAGLPGPLPTFMRRIMCMPVLTWTVRTPAERRTAERYADQMIFEGFRP